MKLTRKQRETLVNLLARPAQRYATYLTPAEYAMFRRLHAKGLVSSPGLGSVHLNDAGRAALKEVNS